MSEDIDLLRQYVSDKSEAAFAALVRQHLGLVYHTALRHLDGDAHGAEDVAQTVFTDLARKAPSLVGRTMLAGWLHTSARYAALKRRRADSRRQVREHEAQLMHELTHDNDAAGEWSRLRGVIDDALLTLKPRDREAVLMHFFEGRDFTAVAERFELSPQGARSLVDRALARMQSALSRRGVTSTAGALSVVLAAYAGSAPPSALAATVTGAALVGAAAPAASSGLVLAWLGANKALLATGLVTVAAVFAVWWMSSSMAAANRATGLDPVAQNSGPQAAASLRAAGGPSGGWLQTISKFFGDGAKHPPGVPARRVLTLQEEQERAILNNLRQLGAATDQYRLENGVLPTSLADIVGTGPNHYVKQIRIVAGEDYSKLSFGGDFIVTTPSGLTVMYRR